MSQQQPRVPAETSEGSKRRRQQLADARLEARQNNDHHPRPTRTARERDMLANW